MNQENRKLLAAIALTVAATATAVSLPITAAIDSRMSDATTPEAIRPQTPAETAAATIRIEAPALDPYGRDLVSTILAEPISEPEPESIYPENAAELIGRTIWGEAGGVKNPAERAAVAWCILNRVDAWNKSIEEVVTAPWQFQGYRPNGDCPQEHIDLATDVLERWAAEKAGEENVGRVLPEDYLFFMGDGRRNWFSTEYLSKNYWDWSMTSPY